MSELAHYQGQVTSASSDSNLQPVASRKVLVTKRGATVDGAHSGTKTAITVLSGALRFSDNDVVMVEGHGGGRCYPSGPGQRHAHFGHVDSC
jgi:hypothetical protein